MSDHPDLSARLSVAGDFLVTEVLGTFDSLAYYLFRDDEVVAKTGYLPTQVFTFKPQGAGMYQVKVFQRLPDGSKIRIWTDKIQVPLPETPSTLKDSRDNGTGVHPVDLAFFNLEPETTRHLESFSEFLLDGWRPDLWISELRVSPSPNIRGWFNSGKVKGESSTVIEEGWSFDGHPRIDFNEDIDWAAPGHINRTWGFELHAWRFIDPVIDDYISNGSPALLHWILEVVESWWGFAHNTDDDLSMAWYDMALSLRSARLARIIVAVAQSNEAKKTLPLLRIALRHIEESKRDIYFHPQNNHGFYTAASNLDLAKLLPMLPGSAELERIGTKRMEHMLHRQFADDGGHLEHSPDYHRMLLGSFVSAIEEGLIDDSSLIEKVDKAGEVLGWMIQPDGDLVQFGDSPAFKMAGEGRKHFNKHTEFLMSDGRRGAPHAEEIKVLPATGYAFVRSPQPRKKGDLIKSGYLAFQAGYHSRAHKHADDLTFTWFDFGQEIVVDSGRFGYVDLLPKDSPLRQRGFFYSAPERQYVESTRAHNTISVNNEDIERRSRDPYGSALGSCSENNGQFIISGSVDHGHYHHKRVLKYRPHELLEIIDTITAKDEPIEAIAWFNLDGSIKLENQRDQIILHLEATDTKLLLESDGELAESLRGEKNPLRGWRSKEDRSLIPVWNLGFKTRVNRETQLVTRFKVLKK